MKKIILLFCFLFFSFHNSFSQGVWTWMSGDSTLNSRGVFGTQGIPSVNNRPPALYGSSCWTDLQGNFWLYGGTDSIVRMYGDLWKFNPKTLEWTWVKGTGAIAQPPNYGTKGIAAPGNSPGSRGFSNCTWVDTSGNLWLYSGSKYDGQTPNDLWKYNIASNEWAWISGSNSVFQSPTYGIMGIPSVSNNPGSRDEIGNAWMDANGKFWLYGGQVGFSAGGACSDMWMYDPDTNEWTWESGTQNTFQLPEYGSKEVYSAVNTPGSRYPYCITTDNKGNFLLFGGVEGTFTLYTSGHNDLWEYSPSINQWAWINGTAATDTPGIAGNSCQADSAFYPDCRFENRAVWKDCAGNFWMYGGFLNEDSAIGDIWVYLVTSKKWARISESSYINANPVYGKLGVSAISNHPGARGGPAHWKDSRGNFWIFGGLISIDGSGPFGLETNYFNDMWRYQPDYNCININCGCTAYAGTIISSRDSICFGTSNLFNVIGNIGSFQWESSIDGVHFSELPNDTLNTYSTPPTLAQTTYYRLIAESGSCGTDTSNTVIVRVIPAPSTNFTYTTNGKQINFQADSVSANVVSYHWDFGDGKTSNEINPVHTFDSVKTYYVCLTVNNNSNCSFTRCQYVSAPSGVQNISAAQFIRLYPNPANNELTIEVLNGNAPKQITITNDLGQTLIQLNTYKTKMQIDIHQLAAGIYFVKTQLADGSMQVNKLVKE